MAKSNRMFKLLAELNPAVYDLIPRGPQRFLLDGGETMLNPQPLPPVDAYVFASVELAYEVARIATIGEITGAPAGDLLAQIFDDWCGTPWPRPWPWPHGAIDRGGDPEPHPEWDLAAGRLAGGLALAALAERTLEGGVRETLQLGAERLIETSIS